MGAPAMKVPRLCSERDRGEEKDPGRRHRNLLGGKGKRRVSFGTFRTAMSPGRKSGYVGTCTASSFDAEFHTGFKLGGRQ